MNHAIVIPALNEARAIRAVVESALVQCPHVIVVDDGSTDGTSDLIRDLPITLLRHDTPQGKAASLRDAFREALARGFDAVITMDGDGQHAAEDIPRMLAAVAQFPGRIVIGARLINREQQPARRRRANAVADWGVSWASGHRVIDSQSGQRYYPKAVMQLVEVSTRFGFVFESEILIEAAWRLGVRTISVPIESRYPDDRRASHFRAVRDTTRITLMIIRRILGRGLLLHHYVRFMREPQSVFDGSCTGPALPSLDNSRGSADVRS